MTVSVTFLVTLTVLPLCLTSTFFLTVSVFVGLQMFVLAARALYLPLGRVSSKLEKGASGTVLNVVDVMPVWPM